MCFKLIGDDTTEVQVDWIIKQLKALPDGIRVLKPDGTLLITVPFSSLTHFLPYHFCGYNHYWYMHHLPALGLKSR